MGDRGNIILRFLGTENSKPVDIFLYTHWRGYALPHIVQRALTKRERWDDPAYLARIIFCELMPASQHGDSTGFGIAPYPCDNQYDYMRLDMDERTVEQVSVGNTEVVRGHWTFEEFCTLDVSTLKDYGGAQ